MSIWVKICGLSDARGIDAAQAAGANAVGFVFAESVRRVTPAHARTLTAALDDSVLRIAVMHHPSAAEWQAVLDELQPDVLQTDASDFGTLEVPGSVRKLPVYRDARLNDERVPDIADWLLYEGAISGSGELSDWSSARQFASLVPTILAGGLTPLNVADAVAAVDPWGVDVSSGVESEPGKKDPAQIAAFVAAARRLEETDECS